MTLTNQSQDSAQVLSGTSSGALSATGAAFPSSAAARAFFFVYYPVVHDGSAQYFSFQRMDPGAATSTQSVALELYGWPSTADDPDDDAAWFFTASPSQLDSAAQSSAIAVDYDRYLLQVTVTEASQSPDESFSWQLTYPSGAAIAPLTATTTTTTHTALSWAPPAATGGAAVVDYLVSVYDPTAKTLTTHVATTTTFTFPAAVTTGTVISVAARNPAGYGQPAQIVAP